MYTPVYSIHQNDQKVHAKNLGLSPEKFSSHLSSANYAYEVFCRFGPFYGKEKVQQPTFRVTARPVVLPKGSRELLTQFGEDILHLGRALPFLPAEKKVLLGDNLEFRLPPTWRVDAIIDEKNNIKANEIEGLDAATALMMAEQFAYNLQTPEQSTAAHLVTTLQQRFGTEMKGNIHLALIRQDVITSRTTPNASRFISYLYDLSNGKIIVDLFDATEIQKKIIRPAWKDYSGVLNESHLSPQDLYQLGIVEDQLITTGNYNAVVNKGVFALVFDATLRKLWYEILGEKRLLRLQKVLIPSSFITSIEDLEKARAEGKVVKVSWNRANMRIINSSRGVALPIGELDHSKDERWQLLRELFEQGARLITQDYIMPAKIPAYLRKKATNLELVEWYNRLCLKYVVHNEEKNNQVYLTAAEVTLGPNVIPAGRQCAFTAGAFY